MNTECAWQGLSAQIVIALVSIMEPDSWLGVELRHFAALQAVAAEGSFGRAAETPRLHAVGDQPADRDARADRRRAARRAARRPARRLADRGRPLLLRHADSIVARLQAAQADLHALRAGEAGTLRVGTFQSVGARLLPEIMRRFARPVAADRGRCSTSSTTTRASRRGRARRARRRLRAAAGRRRAARDDRAAARPLRASSPPTRRSPRRGRRPCARSPPSR